MLWLSAFILLTINLTTMIYNYNTYSKIGQHESYLLMLNNPDIAPNISKITEMLS